MKTATVSCFFILIFAHQLLSGSALELTHSLIDTSLDISRESNMGQERSNGGSRSSVHSKTDDIGEGFESMELRKAQKGKGAYGGANVVHHPPGTRNLGSPTLISSSRSFVNMKSDDYGEDSKSRHAMVLRKSQGHKGSSGGAPNIVHRPPDTRSLGPPTLIISTYNVVCFSFILLHLVLVA